MLIVADDLRADLVGGAYGDAAASLTPRLDAFAASAGALVGAVALFLVIAVASIVETAQTVDELLLWTAGRTCAVAPASDG